MSQALTNDPLSSHLRSWIEYGLLPRLLNWPQSQKFSLPCEALEGEPAQASKISEEYIRLMPICRQVYSLLEAAELTSNEEHKVSALNQARHLFNKITTAFNPGQISKSGWLYALGQTPDTLLYAESRQLYTHAFVIFAAAAACEHLGDTRAKEVALESLEFIETKFRGNLPRGFVSELDSDLRIVEGPLEQNPHMHLLEACIFAYEATKEKRFLEVGSEIVELWFSKFVKGSVLLEFMDKDWEPDSKLGHIIEPGHHFEWVWLIERWIEVAADIDLGAKSIPANDLRQTSHKLVTFAMYHGIDHMKGGVFDGLKATDGSVINNSKRIWPLLEACKALKFALLADLIEDTHYQSMAHRLHTTLNEKYLLPSGLWAEKLNKDLSTRMRSDYPLSTAYHIVCCASELCSKS